MICIVDLETTGVEEDARVVELGYIVYDMGMKMLYGGREYVNPGIPIPATAKAVHHIDDEDVEDADEWSHVAARLHINLRREGVTHMVAHNAPFEQQFLQGVVSVPWVCTLRCAKHVWPDAPAFGNQVLRYWLPGGPGTKDPMAQPPHRVMPDIYVTAFILRELLKVHPVETLVRLTNEPVRLKTVGFGKHFGQQWDAVPLDYLQWVSRQKDMDGDVLHTAKTILMEKTK